MFTCLVSDSSFFISLLYSVEGLAFWLLMMHASYAAFAGQASAALMRVTTLLYRHQKRYLTPKSILSRYFAYGIARGLMTSRDKATRADALSPAPQMATPILALRFSPSSGAIPRQQHAKCLVRYSDLGRDGLVLRNNLQALMLDIAEVSALLKKAQMPLFSALDAYCLLMMMPAYSASHEYKPK